jgi:hypothetical protein
LLKCGCFEDVLFKSFARKTETIKTVLVLIVKVKTYNLISFGNFQKENIPKDF